MSLQVSKARSQKPVRLPPASLSWDAHSGHTVTGPQERAGPQRGPDGKKPRFLALRTGQSPSQPAAGAGSWIRSPAIWVADSAHPSPTPKSHQLVDPHVEQRQTLCDELCTNCRFVSKVNDCYCSKPPFRVVCFAAKNNQSTGNTHLPAPFPRFSSLHALLPLPQQPVLQPYILSSHLGLLSSPVPPRLCLCPSLSLDHSSSHPQVPPSLTSGCLQDSVQKAPVQEACPLLSLDYGLTWICAYLHGSTYCTVL